MCGALAEVVDRLTEDAIVVLLCNGMGVHDEVMSNTQLAGFSYLLAVTTHGAFTTRRYARLDSLICTWRTPERVRVSPGFHMLYVSEICTEFPRVVLVGVHERRWS